MLQLTFRFYSQVLVLFLRGLFLGKIHWYLFWRLFSSDFFPFRLGCQVQLLNGWFRFIVKYCPGVYFSPIATLYYCGETVCSGCQSCNNPLPFFSLPSSHHLPKQHTHTQPAFAADWLLDHPYLADCHRPDTCTRAPSESSARWNLASTHFAPGSLTRTMLPSSHKQSRRWLLSWFSPIIGHLPSLTLRPILDATLGVIRGRGQIVRLT